MRQIKQNNMMSISDLFDSGFQKRNQDHFAAIVKVAMSDNVITDEEKAFLDRLARNLSISENDYKEILKNYESHPINPPTGYDARLERLFDLSRMVYADNIKGDDQVILLEKLSIGLGFNPENAKYVVDKALTLVDQGVDGDDFADAIKTMNR